MFLFNTQAQDDGYYADELEVDEDDEGGRQSSDVLGKRGREALNVCDSVLVDGEGL